jgi:hypothetical protein
MAKAKKESEKAPAKKAEPTKETAAKDSAAKKPAAKKATPKKPAPITIGQSPLIDTSLAASAAARMLAAGFPSKADGGKARQESSMFKQLKAGLNKPHSAAMSNVLDKSNIHDATKQHQFSKQVGHNQTFGTDATRSGVPRRTPG